MVERLLLQVLCTYVDTESDWENHIPLALYAYRTAIHESTGVSLHNLMFGREPHSAVFQLPVALNQPPISSILAKLQDLVEPNQQQTRKCFMTVKALHRTFNVDDIAWLSVPTAGKLDPRWEGKWKITSLKSPTTVEISDGNQHKIVHINRLQHCLKPMETSRNSLDTVQPWHPPQIEHFINEIPKVRQEIDSHQITIDRTSLRTSLRELGAYVD